MLKKVLASVLSISVIGSTLVVPAFADYKTEQTKTTILSENFDSLSLEKSTSTKKTRVGTSQVYWKTNTYGGTKSTIQIADGKMTAEYTGESNDTSFWFEPDTPVSVGENDKIHLNFDYTATGKHNVRVAVMDNFNENDVKAYKGYVDVLNAQPSYNNNTYTNGWVGSETNVWLTNDSSGSIRLGNQITETKNVDFSKGVNVDITIDPYDDAYGNEQTIKMVFKYDTNKTATYYAKYDANVKASTGDTTNDKITSFRGLAVETCNTTSGKYSVDNIFIEKISDDKTYYTSTVKNLIDEDFSDVEYESSPTMSGGGSIDGGRFMYVNSDKGIYLQRSNGERLNGKVVEDEQKGKAFKIEVVNKGDWKEYTGRLIFTDKGNKTMISEGDIIKFSFDMKVNEQTSKDNYFLVGPSLNLIDSDNYRVYNETFSQVPNVENWTNYSFGTGTENEDPSSANNSNNNNENRSRKIMLTSQDKNGLTKYTARDSEVEGIVPVTATANEWHSYEYIINTADPANDGKQTMKVYIDKGKTNEQVLYSTLDLNVKNGETEDKFNYINALSLIVNGRVGGQDFSVLSTNYKLDIIKPGIGLSGNAIKDHDPEAAGGIKLEEGDLKIDVNLNVPGTVKKSSEEAGTGTVASIYVAQYDESGLLKEINVLTTDSGEFTQSNSSISRTIQVKSGVEQVKIFGFDGALRPIFTNVVGGVVKVDPQNISFNTENGVDSSQH